MENIESSWNILMDINFKILQSKYFNYWRHICSWGGIYWRQVLEQGSIGAIDSLSVSRGRATVVTSNPPLLRTFDTSTAALVSEVLLALPFKPPQWVIV